MRNCLCCIVLIYLTCTSAQARLIAEYHFHADAPLSNSVRNGLPDLATGIPWPREREQQPILTGAWVPDGGDTADQFALGWTTRVEPRVEDPDEEFHRPPFSIWIRVFYGGKRYDLVRKGNLTWSVDENSTIKLRVEEQHFTADALKLRPGRWHDLVLNCDKESISVLAREITSEGMGSIRSHVVPFKNPRSLDAGGPLYLLPGTWTVLEMVRIYSGEVISKGDLLELGRDVQIPGPNMTGEVADVGRSRQLFVDDAQIAKTTNIERMFYRPEKFVGNPVADKTQPDEVEGWGPVFWGTVLYDEQEKLYKLWCIAPTFRSPESHNNLYMVSADGISWDKPNLNVIGPDNRIKVPSFTTHPVGHAGMGVMAFKDVNETNPAMKYKGFVEHGGFYYVGSPDGFTWTDVGIGAHLTDDTSFAAWHPRRHEWLKTGRVLCRQTPDHFRTIIGTTNRDALAKGNATWHWMFVPDERDLKRDPDLQLYYHPGFAYEDVYLGVLGIYHSSPADGRIENELTFSRDGLNWIRPAHGKPFIPLGEGAAWDSQMIVMSRAPVTVGDELWFYYGGYKTRHEIIDKGHAAIGLAKLRRDGFASLTSTKDTGTVRTKPFELLGDTIQVNARVRGDVVLRVLDEAGNEVARSEPLRGDGCDLQPVWKGRSNLSDSLRQRVSIEFCLRDADLFAFQVAGDGDQTMGGAQ